MQQGGSQRRPQSLLRGTLRRITDAVTAAPILSIWIALLLGAACIGLTVWKLEFKTRRADLIDPQADFQKRWIEYTESFGESSDVVVVLESDSRQAIRNAMDDLGPRVVHNSDLFRDVLYKIDAGTMREKGLQYLSPEQLRALNARLTELEPIVRSGRWEMMGLEATIARLRGQVDASLRPSARGSDTAVLQSVWLLTDSLTRSIDNPRAFRSPWPDLVATDRNLRTMYRPDIYLVNDDGTMGFLKARAVLDPDNFNGPTRALDRLNELLADCRRDHPEVRFSLTGIPVLEHDEMVRSQKDMSLASAVSFIGVTVLMFIGFRGFRHPLLSMVMLGVAMAWSFGYITLAVGHLNILSMAFAVMLIGIGGDYSVHYLARYLQLRKEGQELRPALSETSAQIGPGLIASALAAAISFFVAVMTDFVGIAELGIIVGGSILLSIVATFLVLPPLVAWADRNVPANKLPSFPESNWLTSLPTRWPTAVMLVSFGLVAVVAIHAVRIEDGKLVSRVKYDHNLLHLQAQGIESVDVQQRMFEKSDDSLLFAVSIANNATEARRLREAFEALPSVHHVVELGSRLPQRPHRETQEQIAAIRGRLAGLPQQLPRMREINPLSFGRNMEQLYQLFRNSRDPLQQQIASAIDTFLDKFDQRTLEDQTRFVSEYQYAMVASLHSQLRSVAAATSTVPIEYRDIPPELSSRFVSSKGQWLVQVFPAENIWEVEPLERFVNDVRTVDPNITGTPLQNFEASRQIVDSYTTAAIYSFVLISFVLLVSFLNGRRKWLTLLTPVAVIAFVALTLNVKPTQLDPVIVAIGYMVMAVAIASVIDARNLRDVILALLTPVLGGVLTFGIMALCKIDLNPANLIVLPLMVGVGVDSGVYILDDFRTQRGTYRMSPSTMNGVIMTIVSSIVGFASLLLAAHKGLQSVGLVLSIGLTCCLFVALVMLPAILATITNGDSESHAEVERPKAAAPRQQTAKAA